MNRMAKRAAILAIVMLPALATSGRTDPAADDSSRFTIAPTDGGFLRLDRQTGAVAICAKKADEWACRPVDEKTASSATERTRLETENMTLKARVKELEDFLASKSLTPPPPHDGSAAEGPPGGISRLPTDAEIDEALDYMSRVYKKIRDHVRELDKPSSNGDHPEPAPLPQPTPPAPKTSL